MSGCFGGATVGGRANSTCHLRKVQFDPVGSGKQSYGLNGTRDPAARGGGEEAAAQAHLQEASWSTTLARCSCGHTRRPGTQQPPKGWIDRRAHHARGWSRPCERRSRSTCAIGSTDVEVQAMVESEDANFKTRLIWAEINSATHDRGANYLDTAERAAAMVPGILGTDSKGGYDAITRHEGPGLGLSNARAAIQG